MKKTKILSRLASCLRRCTQAGWGVCLALMVGCFAPVAAGTFVRVSDGHFVRDGKPYYFVGTNLWYAPILASEGQGGDRARLGRELDRLHAMGVDNLRILVGADAGSDSVNHVRPYLQERPGVLNDTLLRGLDYLLVEMDKRDMVGVFYLTNSWDWSGGYGYYLKQTGHGQSPYSAGEGYNNYVRYAAAFANDEKAQQLFYDYVKAIVGRTNSITGKPYRDDPTIMAWQVCNEPRAFSKEAKEGFARWIARTVALIKQLDPNHLVSTGSEGLYGCEVDADLCERIHNDLNIDYYTIHIWPRNWQWVAVDRLVEDLPNAYLRSGEYIDLHQRMASKAGKPLVIEEFGYPRDYNNYSRQSTTGARDGYYSFIFNRLLESYRHQGILAGCNFWGWGGEAVADSTAWMPGADYMVDPPHEPQGWYSVFDEDYSTIQIIEQTVAALKP